MKRTMPAKDKNNKTLRIQPRTTPPNEPSAKAVSRIVERKAHASFHKLEEPRFYRYPVITNQQPHRSGLDGHLANECICVYQTRRDIFVTRLNKDQDPVLFWDKNILIRHHDWFVSQNGEYKKHASFDRKHWSCSLYSPRRIVVPKGVEHAHITVSPNSLSKVTGVRLGVSTTVKTMVIEADRLEIPAGITLRAKFLKLNIKKLSSSDLQGKIIADVLVLNGERHDLKAKDLDSVKTVFASVGSFSAFRLPKSDTDFASESRSIVSSATRGGLYLDAIEEKEKFKNSGVLHCKKVTADFTNAGIAFITSEIHDDHLANSGLIVFSLGGKINSQNTLLNLGAIVGALNIQCESGWENNGYIGSDGYLNLVNLTQHTDEILVAEDQTKASRLRVVSDAWLHDGVIRAKEIVANDASISTSVEAEAEIHSDSFTAQSKFAKRCSLLFDRVFFSGFRDDPLSATPKNSIQLQANKVSAPRFRGYGYTVIAKENIPVASVDCHVANIRTPSCIDIRYDGNQAKLDVKEKGVVIAEEALRSSTAVVDVAGCHIETKQLEQVSGNLRAVNSQWHVDLTQCANSRIVFDRSNYLTKIWLQVNTTTILRASKLSASYFSLLGSRLTATQSELSVLISLCRDSGIDCQGGQFFGRDFFSRESDLHLSAGHVFQFLNLVQLNKVISSFDQVTYSSSQLAILEGRFTSQDSAWTVEEVNVRHAEFESSGTTSKAERWESIGMSFVNASVHLATMQLDAELLSIRQSEIQADHAQIDCLSGVGAILIVDVKDSAFSHCKLQCHQLEAVNARLDWLSGALTANALSLKGEHSQVGFAAAVLQVQQAVFQQSIVEMINCVVSVERAQTIMAQLNSVFSMLVVKVLEIVAGQLTIDGGVLTSDFIGSKNGVRVISEAAQLDVGYLEVAGESTFTINHSGVMVKLAELKQASFVLNESAFQVEELYLDGQTQLNQTAGCLRVTQIKVSESSMILRGVMFLAQLAELLSTNVTEVNQSVLTVFSLLLKIVSLPVKESHAYIGQADIHSARIDLEDGRLVNHVMQLTGNTMLKVQQTPVQINDLEVEQSKLIAANNPLQSERWQLQGADIQLDQVELNVGQTLATGNSNIQATQSRLTGTNWKLKTSKLGLTGHQSQLRLNTLMMVAGAITCQQTEVTVEQSGLVGTHFMLEGGRVVSQLMQLINNAAMQAQQASVQINDLEVEQSKLIAANNTLQSERWQLQSADIQLDQVELKVGQTLATGNSNIQATQSRLKGTDWRLKNSKLQLTGHQSQLRLNTLIIVAGAITCQQTEVTVEQSQLVGTHFILEGGRVVSQLMQLINNAVMQAQQTPVQINDLEVEQSKLIAANNPLQSERWQLQGADIQLDQVELNVGQTLATGNSNIQATQSRLNGTNWKLKASKLGLTGHQSQLRLNTLIMVAGAITCQQTEIRVEQSQLVDTRFMLEGGRVVSQLMQLINNAVMQAQQAPVQINDLEVEQSKLIAANNTLQSKRWQMQGADVQLDQVELKVGQTIATSNSNIQATQSRLNGTDWKLKNSKLQLTGHQSQLMLSALIMAAANLTCQQSVMTGDKWQLVDSKFIVPDCSVSIATLFALNCYIDTRGSCLSQGGWTIEPVDQWQKDRCSGKVATLRVTNPPCGNPIEIINRYGQSAEEVVVQVESGALTTLNGTVGHRATLFCKGPVRLGQGLNPLQSLRIHSEGPVSGPSQ